ncbi:MAG: DUF1178 family protein [Alphaproteobacteria bacterium]|nr:DUF1178 family protein [Alphaproteobacteria bacterium]
MILYTLRCSQDHQHEGWFKDSATFERLARRGALACPACGDTKVGRALMAPAVASKKEAVNPQKPPRRRKEAPPAAPAGAEAPATPAPAAAAPAAAAAGPLPDQVRAVLMRLREEVEKNCDYVGSRFPEEARRIHKGQGPARGIYGEASKAEAEALKEEGIEVDSIPWLPRADA